MFKTNEADKPKRGADPWIWAVMVLLCIISLITTYSASSQEVASSGLFVPIIRHGVFLLMGIAAAYLLQHVHYRYFRKVMVVAILLSLFLVFYTMNWGAVINGARRSLEIPLINVTFYPSELAKLTAVAAIAWLMSNVQVPGGGTRWSGVILCALMVGLFGVMLFPQGFTNCFILMSISFAMMLIGGVRMKQFIIVIALYAVCFVGYRQYDRYVENRESALNQQVAEIAQALDDRSATRDRRIETFSFFEEDCLAHPMESYYHQEQYGYMARAHGGVLGVGPGNSRECARLPLAFSDYVFSIIVEEWGLLGGVLLMVLYVSLMGRAGSIAWKCKYAFPALLIMGMATMITLQALAHIAINSGLVPVTGQPLPLISKGGTSILLVGVAFGMMLSVSRYAEYSAEASQQRGGKPQEVGGTAAGGVSEALNPANS